MSARQCSARLLHPDCDKATAEHCRWWRLEVAHVAVLGSPPLARSDAMSLTERETHFEFGENWKNYAKTIDQKRIDSAIAGVKKLFPDGLAGKTFLDIGCGSGLH